MNGTPRLSGRLRFGRTASFAVLVSANVVLMASTSAPSPIYPLYLQRWGLSVTTLTAVFAVYVAGLTVALLIAGSLSDYLGRRPVLVASLLVAAAGTAIFWAAGGVVWLVVARVVQGIATGTASGALAAGLVEFSPEGRSHLGPTMTAAATAFGLALGGGLAGFFVAASPHPDAVMFPALTAAFMVLAAATFALPETAPRRAGVRDALRPRVGVPRETRIAFVAALPAIVASWAATGLFLALAPSLVRDVLHVGYGAAGGLSITVLFIANCAGGLSAARLSAHNATVVGTLLLTIGAGGLAAALAFASPSSFTCAAVVVGLGVGLTFTGTLRSISDATSAAARSEVFSAVFVVSYLALGIPSLVAGLAAPWWGLTSTTSAYLACVAVLALSAAVPRSAYSFLSAPSRIGADKTSRKELQCRA